MPFRSALGRTIGLVVFLVALAPSVASAQFAWGLVNRVIAPERLLDAARELALDIAANDQLAVRLTKQAINQSMDRAGMREALLAALETDVEIESTETEESKRFNEILKEQGTRAAIAWRSAQVR